jgi:hypothetical protein
VSAPVPVAPASQLGFSAIAGPHQFHYSIKEPMNITTQRSLLVAFIALMVFSNAHAQTPYRCGTDEAHRQALANDPHLLEREAQLETFIQQWIADHRGARELDTVVYTIPVVFHVLHMDGPENISNEQILDEIAVLNRDYRRLNPDIANLVPGYAERAADVRLHFKLATIDPEGHCTTGIQRVRTVETFVGDNGSKVRFWPRGQYLNIWTVARIESGAAGYSQYPSAVEGGEALADGVLLLHDYVGRIGTGDEGKSRALTHEVGHYLNLQHVWGDNNGGDSPPPGNMVSLCDDDQVYDTPITKGHSDCNNRFDFTCSEEQVDSTYSFTTVTTTSGTTDPRGALMLTDTLRDDTNAVLSPFTANGVSSNSTVNGAFAFQGWSLGAQDSALAFADLSGSINTGQYYEFTITPNLIHAMTLSGMSFTVSRSLTGPRTFAVRCSTNGSTSNLAASVAPPNPGLTVQAGNVFFLTQDSIGSYAGARITVSGNQFTRITGPITFRIYAWNAEDAAGSFVVDDVRLLGLVGIIENVENYMEYSYCSKMFTNGQMLRMRAALASSGASRNTLWAAATLASTGTDGITDRACAPEADFTVFNQAASGSGSDRIPGGTRWYCQGDQVQFFDNSQVGIPTTWSWTFQDGIPATSTLHNPQVIFNAPGWKTISLTVTNDQGSSSTISNEKVFIAYSYPELPGAIQEGFESDQSTNGYFVENYEDNNTAWDRTENAGYQSSASMRLNAFETLGNYNDFPIDDSANDLDAFVTPTMDLTWLQDGQLTFWYAYATNTSNVDEVTESLEVWSSNSCGRNWTRRAAISGLDLLTNGGSSSFYVPSSDAEWRQAIINLPSAVYNDQVRFKFLYRSSAASNNLYIDDINMAGTVGLGQATISAPTLALAPNPTEGTLAITYTLPAQGSGQLRMLDAQGRLVWSRVTRNVAQERVVLDVRELSLASGVYSVQLIHGAATSTLRLLVR